MKPLPSLTKKIKRRSNKRAKQERLYLKLRDKFLQENPQCAVHKLKFHDPWGGVHFCVATQVHHKKGRIGDLLTDVRYFLPVCDEGHKEIEDNPKWAKEQGFSLNRLSKTENI